MNDTTRNDRDAPEDVRHVLERAAELPREIEPPRDLWPGIAARLAERTSIAPAPRRSPFETLRRWLTAPPWLAWTPGQWAWQATAAAVFMALGGLAARGVSAPSAGDAVRSPDGDGVFLPASVVSAGTFKGVEAEYLRAKENLWILVLDRRDELSPVTVNVVERNLHIIDEAIRELRTALATDPGNRQLEDQLLAQHRRSIRLLQRLAEDSV